MLLRNIIMRSRFYHFFKAPNAFSGTSPLIGVTAIAALTYVTIREESRKYHYEKTMYEAGYDKIILDYKEVMECRTIPVGGATCEMKKAPWHVI